MITGVALEAYSSFFQRIFSPLAVKESGSPFSRDWPFCSGPRQLTQSVVLGLFPAELPAGVSSAWDKAQPTETAEAIIKLNNRMGRLPVGNRSFVKMFIVFGGTVIESIDMEAAKFAMTWDRWIPICRGGAIGNIAAKPSVAANRPKYQYTKFPSLLDVKRGTAISLPSRNCVLFVSNPPV
jgi:hypothetical protein